MDAKRLKRNTGIIVHANRDEVESIEILRHLLFSVLEHHFNNHNDCGDWCPFIKLKDDKEKQSKLLYRSKDNPIDLSIYYDLKEIFIDYTSDKYISEIFHCWDTNVNESFNKFVTKFLRKDSYYCETICAKSRVHIATSIFNNGYVGYYSKLFQKYGLNYYNNIIYKHHLHLDLMREYHQEYKRRKDVKRRKNILKILALREEIKKELLDKMKGKEYKKNISGPESGKKNKKKMKTHQNDAEDQSTKGGENNTGKKMGKKNDDDEKGDGDVSMQQRKEGKEKRKKNEKVSETKGGTKRCKTCGKEGHVRRSHRDCSGPPLEKKQTHGTYLKYTYCFADYTFEYPLSIFCSSRKNCRNVLQFKPPKNLGTKNT